MCGQHPEEPAVLVEAGQLTVKFIVGRLSKHTTTMLFPGYRLLFTIYQESERPIQLPNGKWNCTEENWDGVHGLEPHLACNVKHQCEDGRDEEACGYTRCQQVGFEVAGRCFFLGWRMDSTHTKADWLCQHEQQQGARLASLKSAKIIDEVRKIVWRLHPFYIKIGLATPTVELPPM
ncbi:hypothetical protein ACOMHN_023784 [Nucella lapillus]